MRGTPIIYNGVPYELVLKGSELQAERDRVLKLLERTTNQLRQNRWRGAELALDRLQRDIYFGTQLMDYEVEYTTDSSLPTFSAPVELGGEQ